MGAHGIVGEMLHEEEEVETGGSGTVCASQAPAVNNEAQGSGSGWCTGVMLVEEEGLETGPGGDVTGLMLT